jgi:hypothetical protein
MLISNPLKNVKQCSKKVKSKTNLKNISKSDKSAFFRRVFVNNFFVHFYKNLSNGIEISVKFSVFVPF